MALVMKSPVSNEKPVAARAPVSVTGGSIAARRLVGAVVVLGAAITTLAGALSLFAPAAFLAAIGHRGEPLTAGVQVFAAYTGARDLALGVALLVLLVRRSTRALPVLVLVLAGANAADGVDALASQRWAQAPGALVFSLAFLIAALWMFKWSRRS